MRAIQVGAVAFLFFVASCNRIEEKLTKGLEAEKSYTRYAMETYRQDPNIFREDKNVLEVWSRMDYVGQAVAAREVSGTWAKTSDKLLFLNERIRANTNGMPFCVIKEDNQIVVLAIWEPQKVSCAPDQLRKLDLNKIQSGDMDFSGRLDYWIYVVRPPAMN